MSLLTRLDIYLIQRRAARKVRAIADEKAARAHLNRPHVQSAHMIGWYISPRMPTTARDFGVTPSYVAFLLIVAVMVALLNTDDNFKAATVCSQIASAK